MPLSALRGDPVSVGVGMEAERVLPNGDHCCRDPAARQRRGQTPRLPRPRKLQTSPQLPVSEGVGVAAVRLPGQWVLTAPASLWL